MLSVKFLVVFLAVCVTHTCLVSGEGYSFQKDMGSTKNQTQGHLVLTPTSSETPHPEKTPSAEAVEVYMPIPIETPRPETLLVEETKVYAPTPTEKPCSHLPIPSFEAESDTEALTKETALHTDEPVPETPSPVVTLVMETHSPLKSTPHTPTPPKTEPCPKFALASETKARQNEETATAYPAPAPTAPCPTLIIASETEASRT